MSDDDLSARSRDALGVDRGRPAPPPRAGRVEGRPRAGDATAVRGPGAARSATGRDDGPGGRNGRRPDTAAPVTSGTGRHRTRAGDGGERNGSARSPRTPARGGAGSTPDTTGSGAGDADRTKGTTTGTTAGAGGVAKSGERETATTRRGTRRPEDGDPVETSEQPPDGSGARVIPLRAESARRTRGERSEAGPASPEAPGPEAAEPTGPSVLEESIERLAAFVRRRVDGDYQVDEFGFDPDLTDNVIIPALRPLYRSWFRVETIGMHHVPDVGGALVVANHSGTLPLDALMTAVALHDEHPARRHLRMLGADLVFRLPVLGALTRKQGATLACNPDAERLMSSGELVGVWPEGFKGIGKPFKDRYKLQRFGRGGFVSAALRTGVPIIPCSIVGAEEIYPKIGDIKPLARLFGAPYFPVTPTFPLLGPLGAVPLPSKWYIEFGEPIRTDAHEPADADDPMLVFNLTDQVRESIQHTLYRLLSQRRNAFLG
ncbi:hypothetical protein GCM10023403_12340 [Pseudonocardia benzenivorans]